MGQKDLSVRLLAERHFPSVLALLYPGAQAKVIERLPTLLKIVTERIPDGIHRVCINGREMIIHVEFETQIDPHIAYRIVEYQGLLRAAYRLPAHSVVVYLLPEPTSEPPPNVLDTDPDDDLQLRFEIFKPWEHPIDLDMLDEHPMLAPLAILTPGISKADLPALRDRVMASDEPHNNKLDVLAFTRVLGSSRFSPDLLQSVIRSEIMEHFPEYQRILGKGEARGIQKGKREGKREGISHAIHAIVQGRLGVVPDELDARLAPLTLKKLDALLLRLAASQDEEALRTALADLT